MTPMKPILDGGRYFEGPRWHAGRLWFVDCMERTLQSLAPSGECEQHAKFEDDTPCGLGVLPDGRIVVAEMDGECLAEYDIEADGGLNFRRRFGRMKTPDGICLDHEQAVWVASFDEDAFIRVDRGGRELQRLEVPGRRAIACVLGGP